MMSMQPILFNPKRFGVELANGITLTSGDSGDDTVSGYFRYWVFYKKWLRNFNFFSDNTYTGDTTISAGHWQLPALSDSTDVINSGTYDVDATDTIQSKWLWSSSIAISYFNIRRFWWWYCFRCDFRYWVFTKVAQEL